MSVDKSGQRIRQMFGEISSRYDLNNHVLSGGVDYYWRHRTVAAIDFEVEGPILDACTGTGDLALAIARHQKGSRLVVGSDFTHQMLEIANQKHRAGKSAADRVPFIEADTQELPFADDTFAAVTVAFGLRNVTSTERGLKEMARVTKPGGQVLVLEFSKPKNRIISPLYQWYFRNVLPVIGQLLARNDQSAYDYLPQSVGEFPDGKELTDLMESCGMTNATWKPLTFGIATLYVARKPDASTATANDHAAA
ncbi:bifunctional demethylmenaquinone methyltransferase/2-methoxy-6-polyprenyl-1,4-benzoquinol methylase UbiE [Stratiformator vulcanicus]|uniref:Demethylmenaquinone methyltransferase n=1 Tax=Stratiformator vulcanicus TaxID=2527980 RepID=A0A517R3P8_9PLAN|nr:bifunctional demethylmenaquinone methyltransferase/2-methoxy-6-polyprenyl-1,4-benzoquinol methylase UbiE [Stratiformator vulcanicus]QDT38518.1 UbiE/COQ5 methyltransferase [Stratiformator vulcanicus]